MVLKKVEEYDNIILYKSGAMKMDRKGIMKDVKIAVISTVIASAICGLFNYGVSVKVNEANIENINTQLASINDSIEEIQRTQTENSNTLSGHEAIIEMLKKDYENSRSTSAKKISFLNSNFLSLTFEYPERILSAPKVTEGKSIAIGYDDDKEYTAEQLQNTPIVTYYIEGGNEVCFYGQYNENNNWHGECILNVYKNNELKTVFKGIYNNGVLCNYERISCDENEQWTYAARTNCGDYTEGETWTYKKDKAFEQEVTIENFDENQIVTIESLLPNVNKELIQYYQGKTSSGYYNDDTGQAYLVTYKDDGNVDYLYVGKIKNGYPHDDTGNAWFVGWGNGNNGYYYYKGIFTDGEHGKAPKNWKPMTQEEISEKVNQDEFNCPLTGLID